MLVEPRLAEKKRKKDEYVLVEVIKGEAANTQKTKGKLTPVNMRLSEHGSETKRRQN